MPKGKVSMLVSEFFEPSKGFGFIAPDGAHGATANFLFHHSSVGGTGFKTLAEDQEVEYEIAKSSQDQEVEYQIADVPEWYTTELKAMVERHGLPAWAGNDSPSCAINVNAIGEMKKRDDCCSLQ